METFGCVVFTRMTFKHKLCDSESSRRQLKLIRVETPKAKIRILRVTRLRRRVKRNTL